MFQQLELDYTLGAPHPRARTPDLLEVPIIRMFGVTDAGAIPASESCMGKRKSMNRPPSRHPDSTSNIPENIAFHMVTRI